MTDVKRPLFNSIRFLLSYTFILISSFLYFHFSFLFHPILSFGFGLLFLSTSFFLFLSIPPSIDLFLSLFIHPSCSQLPGAALSCGSRMWTCEFSFLLYHVGHECGHASLAFCFIMWVTNVDMRV